MSQMCILNTTGEQILTTQLIAVQLVYSTSPCNEVIDKGKEKGQARDTCASTNVFACFQ